MTQAWLLLIYKIPREPTADRVYVWRKLQQLGAIALQDAAWALPKTPRTEEQFQWLAAEVTERGGEAILWEATQLYSTDAAALRQQFVDVTEASYRELMTALKKKDCDRAAISKRFLEVQSRDFFNSPLGQQVRDRLLSSKGGKSR